MPSTLIRNATILTMNERLDVVDGSIVVTDGRIARVGAEPFGNFSRDPDIVFGFVERSHNLTSPDEHVAVAALEPDYADRPVRGRVAGGQSRDHQRRDQGNSCSLHRCAKPVP